MRGGAREREISCHIVNVIDSINNILEFPGHSLESLFPSISGLVSGGGLNLDG